MMEYILGSGEAQKEDVIDQKILRALFHIYSSDLLQRMSLTLFKNLLTSANRVHPLYLKFRYRYKSRLEQFKSKWQEDLQRLDVEKGDGFVLIGDFK
jgi:hypothetical protein